MNCSPPGSSVHEDSPWKDTGVGCHALLQGTFLTWGSNPLSPVVPALQVNSFTAETPREASVLENGTAYLEMVKMVNLMLSIFYYNKKAL